jgi:hypothetical protein
VNGAQSGSGVPQNGFERKHFPLQVKHGRVKGPQRGYVIAQSQCEVKHGNLRLEQCQRDVTHCRDEAVQRE